MCIGLSGEYTNHQTGTLGITEITCVTVAVMLHRPENLSKFFKLSEDNMDVLHDGNGLTLLVRKQTFHGFNPDRSVRVNTPGNTFTTKYNAISYFIFHVYAQCYRDATSNITLYRIKVTLTLTHSNSVSILVNGPHSCPLKTFSCNRWIRGGDIKGYQYPLTTVCAKQCVCLPFAGSWFWPESTVCCILNHKIASGQLKWSTTANVSLWKLYHT